MRPASPWAVIRRSMWDDYRPSTHHARGVVADLQDRRAIKWGFGDIDEEIRVEIISSLADIIRAARDDA